ncbi:MAG: hypothetical protein ACWGNB_08925 [Thiogranum sp.]
MKLVQKIISHGLFIAFVVTAFFLYTNRTELFPRWFAGSSAASADSDAGQDVATADVAPEDVAPATTVTRPLPEKTLVREPVAPAEDTPEEQSVPPKPAEEQSADQAAVVSEEESGPAAVVDEGAAGATDAEHNWAVPEQGLAQQPSYRPLDEGDREEAGPAATEPTAGEVEASSVQAEDEAPATEVEQAQPTVEDAGTTVAPGATDDNGTAQAEGAESQADSTDRPAVEAQPVTGETTDLARQLEQARSLYWKQQSEAAESAYQALAREHADNAELWGEIGNFYYSLGRNEQAVEAYSRAIELLVRDDKQERARQLLEVLSRLDQQKARELEMKMR